MATLSSGTNNTFPDLREATTTGLAAALVATGRVPAEFALRRHKVLALAGPGIQASALVDVCVTSHEHLGSRALWKAEHLLELFVAFAESDAIGLSSLAGLTAPVSRTARFGLRMRFGEGDRAAGLPRVTAPIAPGLFAEVAIAEARRMLPGRAYPVRTRAGTIALDGEREFEFGPYQDLTVTLSLDGPFTVDVPRALRYAADHRLLIDGQRNDGRLRENAAAGRRSPQPLSCEAGLSRPRP